MGEGFGSFADGTGVDEGCESFLAVLGDAGRLPCLVRVGDERTVGGEDALSNPFGTNPRITSSNPPLEDNESASDRASPRSNSTSYASRELVRRMSSVRLVRVVERRVVWAARADIWDWV